MKSYLRYIWAYISLSGCLSGIHSGLSGDDRTSELRIKKENYAQDLTENNLPPAARLRLGSLYWRAGEKVHDAVFTRNGEQVITISESKLVFWETKSGRRTGSLDVHSAGRCLAASPDGAIAISGHDDGTVILWDLTNRKIKSYLKGHTQSINSVALSTDSRTAVSAGYDGKLLIWDISKGELLHAFKFSDDTILAACLNKDGSLVLSSHDPQNSKVVLWSVREKRLVRVLSEAAGSVNSVAFDCDGKLAVLASFNQVEIRELSGTLVRSLVHSNPIDFVRTSLNCSRLVSGGSKQPLTVWDLASGGKIREFNATGCFANDGQISPDGRWILGWNSDGALFVWDTETGQPCHPEQGHVGNIILTRFISNGSFFLTAGTDGRIIEWEPSAAWRKRHSSLQPLMDRATVSRCGQFVATGGIGREIEIWNLKTGDRSILVRERIDATFVAFTPCGTFVLVGEGRRIRMWERRTGDLVQTFDFPNGGIVVGTVSPDGRWLVCGTSGGELAVWQVATGQGVRRFDRLNDYPSALAFRPDGNVLFASSVNGSISIWNFPNGDLVRTLKSPYQPILSLAPSHDGILLATGDKSGTVILWNVETGEIVSQFAGHLGPVRSLAFSLGDRFLASGSSDTTVIIWHLGYRHSTDAIHWASQWQNKSDLARLAELKYLLNDLENRSPDAWSNILERLLALDHQAMEALISVLSLDSSRESKFNNIMEGVIDDLEADDPQVRQQARDKLLKEGRRIFDLLNRKLAKENLPAETKSSLEAIRELIRKTPISVEMDALARIRGVMVLLELPFTPRVRDLLLNYAISKQGCYSAELA